MLQKQRNLKEAETNLIELIPDLPTDLEYEIGMVSDTEEQKQWIQWSLTLVRKHLSSTTSISYPMCKINQSQTTYTVIYLD